MFRNFEIKQTASALICTLLFSTTCVLSAVGPAHAVEARPLGAQFAAVAIRTHLA